MEDSFIDRLRNKPTHKRHVYTASASLVIVALIFGVWLSVKLPGFSGDKQTLAVEETRQTQKTESIFSAFTDNVAQVFVGFENVFDSAKDMFKSKTEYQSEDNQ